MVLPNPITEQGDLTAQRANLLTSRAVRLQAQAASLDPQVAAQAQANPMTPVYTPPPSVYVPPPPPVYIPPPLPPIVLPPLPPIVLPPLPPHPSKPGIPPSVPTLPTVILPPPPTVIVPPSKPGEPPVIINPPPPVSPPSSYGPPGDPFIPPSPPPLPIITPPPPTYVPPPPDIDTVVAAAMAENKGLPPEIVIPKDIDFSELPPLPPPLVFKPLPPRPVYAPPTTPIAGGLFGEIPSFTQFATSYNIPRNILDSAYRENLRKARNDYIAKYGLVALARSGFADFIAAAGFAGYAATLRGAKPTPVEGKQQLGALTAIGTLGTHISVKPGRGINVHEILGERPNIPSFFEPKVKVAGYPFRVSNVPPYKYSVRETIKTIFGDIIYGAKQLIPTKPTASQAATIIAAPAAIVSPIIAPHPFIPSAPAVVVPITPKPAYIPPSAVIPIIPKVVPVKPPAVIPIIPSPAYVIPAPSVPIPSPVPEISTIPVPAIPSLPAFTIPSIPAPAIPAIPSPAIPAIPSIPAPTLGISVPTVPTVPAPEITVPTPPRIPIPPTPAPKPVIPSPSIPTPVPAPPAYVPPSPPKPPTSSVSVPTIPVFEPIPPTSTVPSIPSPSIPASVPIPTIIPTAPKFGRDFVPPSVPTRVTSRIPLKPKQILPVLPRWPSLYSGGGGGGIARHGARSSYVQYGIIPEMYVALPTFKKLKPEKLGEKSWDKIIRQPEGLELLGEESEEPVQTLWGPKYVRKVTARVRLKVGATEKQRKVIGLTTPEGFYADKVITKKKLISKKTNRPYTAYETLPGEDIGVQKWIG